VLYANIVIANVCGFSIGFIANYFLGLMFVFYDKDISMQHKKLLYTLIISIIGLVINTTIVSVFSNVIACSVYINKLIPCNVAYNNLNEILAKLLAAVVTFNWNFFARKLFVYKN
jgi:putative flippase GtrA